MELVQPNPPPRNILEKFKDWTDAEIRSHCQKVSCDAAVAMMHTHGDFNLSTVLRNANFFGLRECMYIGQKHWDRRGAVGTQNYTPITHLPTEEEFWDYVKGKYTPIAIENNTAFKVSDVYNFAFPTNSLFILGEEQKGLSEAVLSKCSSIVAIPAFGCVRSLNVGTASGVVMALHRAQHPLRETIMDAV
jgi:tRNA G18 (ribose-2'-O)-methylase SpoU